MLKSNLGLYHFVLTTPKNSPEKLILTVVQKKQLPDIERAESKEEVSRVQWTRYNGSRKVCVNFHTDKDNLIFVVYRYRKKYNSKIMKLIWNWQNTSHFWQNEFISWATLTYSTSGALYWMKQLCIIKTNSVKNGCFFLMSIFRLYPRLEMSFENNRVHKNPLSKCKFLLGF